MSDLLREVVGQIEQLPTAEQDAIAKGLRRELDARDARQRRRDGLAALVRLADLTADLPAVDAVRVARESRDALADRLAP